MKAINSCPLIQCENCICAVRDNTGKVIGCLDFTFVSECSQKLDAIEYEYREVLVAS
jgi:hypothetical protein